MYYIKMNIDLWKLSQKFQFNTGDENLNQEEILLYGSQIWKNLKYLES